MPPSSKKRRTKALDDEVIKATKDRTSTRKRKSSQETEEEETQPLEELEVTVAVAAADTDQETEDEDDFILPPQPQPLRPPPSKRARNSNGGSTRVPRVPLPPPPDVDTQSVGSQSSQRPRGFDKLRKTLRRKRKDDTAVPCSGIIKSIKMFNFMCHAGFTQEWHPNLNFVTGENGSGKSALLTALLVGLGGKAALTSRTKSITSLIQKGKDHARTEITLINNGSIPIGKYGPEIMIERTISKSGVSTYRLKGIGKIRKMKKHELEYILLAFNIQLDNPVAILNQEVAKNFLRTKDPKDKYHLFYQGTLLSKLFELLDDSKHSIEISEKNLNVHKNLLINLRAEVRQIEAKLKEVDNLSTVRLKSQMLGREYFWAVANDEEKQMNKLKERLEGEESGIGEMMEKLDSCGEKKRAILDEIQPGQDRTAEIRNKIREKEKTLEDTRKELTSSQKIVQNGNVTIRTNRDLARRKERMMNDLKVTLDRMQSSAQADKEKIMQEYEDEKRTLTEERVKTLEVIASLRQDSAQFVHGVDAARAETNMVEDELKNCSRNLESKTRHLNALTAKGGNKYAIFGRNMETLMSKINTNLRKFSKPPRGPIAATLTVKDPKCTDIVENILQKNGFLVTFMVNSNEDLVLLKRLIQEAYAGDNSQQYGRQSTSSQNRPGIRVNAFSDRPYELGNGYARVRGVSTLLDLIEVEDNDPVIRNGLCDYVNAEQTLVFESNQAAAVVMKDTSKFPSCTKVGYTLDWYRFQPAPAYSAHALYPAGTRARYIKSSKSAQIEGLKAEVHELQMKLDEMKPVLNQKRKEEADLRRVYDRMRTQQEERRRELAGIERSLKENESKKYKEPDVASHVEEITDLENGLERIARENEEAESRIQESTRKIEALKNQKEELQFNVIKLQKSIDDGEEERRKKEKEIKKIELYIEKIKNKLADMRKTKEPTVENLKKSEKEYERKLKQAEECGEKVQSKRTAAEVKRDVEDIKVKMAALEKHIGDTDKLKLDLKKKSTELNGQIKEFGPMYQSFSMLKGVVNSQITFLFRKRISITNGLTYMFTSLVEQRGYKGNMVIDHDKKDLHFFINPDQSSAKRTNQAMGDSASNSKKCLVEYSLGLSGGERSFSTICFIISLWQVMECPFYMLDEFDVFMDAFNRKASQQALIVHAKNQKSHQFFLFSPLDLVEIPARNEATVIRLKPARPDNENSFSGDNEAENVDPSQNSQSTSQPRGTSAPKGTSRSKSTRSAAAAMTDKNRAPRR